MTTLLKIFCYHWQLMMSTKLESFFSLLAKLFENVLHSNCSQDNVLSRRSCHSGKYLITFQSLKIFRT